MVPHSAQANPGFLENELGGSGASFELPHLVQKPMKGFGIRPLIRIAILIF